MKTVPAGVSKRTGKAYRAFEVCETKDCKEKKEIRRSQVPFTPQNTPQLNFEANAVISEIQTTIAKIRIAFAAMDERIKTLETLALGANKTAFDLHSPSVSHTDIPVIQATDGDKVKIDFPEGFLK